MCSPHESKELVIGHRRLKPAVRDRHHESGAPGTHCVAAVGDDLGAVADRTGGVADDVGDWSHNAAILPSTT